MGTSLLDQIQKPPVKRQGVSLLSQIDTTDTSNDVDSSENDSLGHKFSSFLNYLSDQNDKTMREGAYQTIRHPVENIAKPLGGAAENIGTDLKNTFDYYKSTPLHQVKTDAIDMFSSAGSAQGLSAIGKGVIGIVETPISTLTKTINDNGVAKPASPEQQIQNMQGTLGIIAQLKTYKMLSASMLGAIPESEAALAASRPMQVGKIAIGANTRQAMKLIGADAAAGGISGGIGGEVSSAGTDNHEAIIAGALSFLPLTAALGILGVPSRLKEFNENVNTFKAKQNLSATHDIAAANSLRINSNNSSADLLNRVDAVSSADKLVHAAISNKLQVGDGYIVEGVSKDLGTDLHEKLNPSLRKSPEILDPVEAEKLKSSGQEIPKGTYVPPSSLAGPKPRPFGTEVKFESPFDKMAYLVAGKSRSALAESLLQNAMEQTGLTETEIVSHGKFIRKQANESVKSGKLNPRSQVEIDAHEAKSIERGKAMLDKTLPGGVVQDNLGTTYLRTPEGTITDGKVSLPVDQTNTHKIIGRPRNDNPLYQPFANLGKQEFQPNFGRDHFPDFRTYYSPTNGSLLVFPRELTPSAVKSFETNGFLPREVVNVNGNDMRVVGFGDSELLLEEPNTGARKYYSNGDVRRTNHSLQPDISKQGVKAPVLTPEVYVNDLYTKYRNAFNETLNQTDPTSYNDFSQRFFLDNGVKDKDISNIHSYFLNKLGDDLSRQTLSPEEHSIRSSLKNEIETLDDSFTQDTGYDLANQALSNNLFFSSEGSGSYRLRYPDGSTYANVKSLAEARDAINRIRQQQGLDLDGGSSGSVATGLGNIGGLTQQIPKTTYSKWSEFLDRSKAFGFLNNVTNPYNWFKSLDNITEKTSPGKGTQLLPGFLESQKALMKKKLMMDNDPVFSKLGKEAQSILDMGGRLKSERRWTIADNLETQTLDQIANNYVQGRKATNIELEMGKKLAASGDIAGIKQLLFDTKMENKQSSIGSSSYLQTLLAKGAKVDKKVLSGAMDYINTITKYGENQASGPMILKLAEAYDNPSAAMDNVSHARANNIQGVEKIYRDRVQAWFQSAGEAAGIDPKSRISAYLPNIMNKVAGSRNFSGEIPEEFARELTRAGITPSSKMIRDPNQLIIRYFNALLNHKSGATAAINKFSDFVNTEADKFDGTPHEPIKGNFLAAANEYVDELKGYPSPRDGMARVGRQIAAKLGIKSTETNSVLGIMSLGMIAGRPLLAYRDFHNIMGQSYQNFGLEFTRDFIGNATNPEYVADLKRKGILAPNSRQLIDPGMDEGNLLSQGAVGQTIRKWSEKSFNISGQEFAYEHANASIYRTSINLAEKYFKQLRESKMSKEQVYSKMGISSNYGPGWIKQFDDMLQKDEFRAADFYAQSNMRSLSNVYGFHNNPVGWSSNFGRFLGQYGSYAVNATGSMLESISKGSKKEIAAKILRGGMFNKATTLVGSGLGLNLSSWQVGNPLSIGSIANTLPGIGPLASIPSDIADDYMKGRLNPLSESWRAARMFVPYSSMAKGWLNGLDALGQGQLIKSLMVAGGAPADNSPPK